MLMMLPSPMNVVVWLICGNSLSWLLNLNLTFETLWRLSGLLISMLGKCNLLRLIIQITLVLCKISDCEMANACVKL